MRRLLFGLALVVGSAALGCGPSKPTRQNDPPPPPQDSGADREVREKPGPPPKKE